MDEEITLEKYIRELILNNIKDAVRKNTTYQHKDYIYQLIEDNYYMYCEYPNIINYFLDKFLVYILNILAIELCQLNDDEYEDMINIKEDWIDKIKDKDDYIDENDENEKQEHIKEVYNQKYNQCLTYLNKNKEINSIFSKLAKKINKISTHLSADKRNYQILDILSTKYLLDDLNTAFDDAYFLNDMGFLFKNINQDYFPYSLNKYLSFIVYKSRLKRNIFTISEHIKELALHKEITKSKNYIREIKSLENKYNSYIKEINNIFNDENLSKYDSLVLKSLFDNFLNNDFFSSLDSELFCYLTNKIDMVYLYNHTDLADTLELMDKFKIEEMNFNINIIKLFMIFNINLNELINNSLNTELVIFSRNNQVLCSAKDGFVYKCQIQNLLALIFEILWNFYILAGEIISTIMNSYFADDSYDKKLKCVYELLQKKPSNKKYGTITFSNLSNTFHKKSQSLLYAYLFLSKIHQNIFYNLHYE